MTDLFPEMRKAARRFKPAADLATEGVERREKYSMGSGYYLAANDYGRHGWIVRKMVRYQAEWPAEVFLSLAKLHTLPVVAELVETT